MRRYKLLHAADVHLGYKNKQMGSNMDPDTGRPMRELDFTASFLQIVDEAIRRRPDAFIVAGDLFDAPKVSNAVLIDAIKAFNLLEEEGIRTIVIAGNHDTPQARTSKSTFESLSEVLYEHVSFVYDSVERFDIDGLEIVAVPHLALEEEGLADKAAPSRSVSVIVVHGVYMGREEFRQLEMRERPIPDSILSGRSYVALGHLHMRHEAGDGAWYPGSLECTAFGEERSWPKGGLEAVIDGDGRLVSVEVVPVDARRHVDLGIVDADGMNAAEVVAAAKEAISGADIYDAIARLRIRGLQKNVYDAIPKKEIDEAAAGAFFYKTIWELSHSPKAGGSGSDASRASSIKPLIVEYAEALRKRFEAAGMPAGSEEEEGALKLGSEILEECMVEGHGAS